MTLDATTLGPLIESLERLTAALTPLGPPPPPDPDARGFVWDGSFRRVIRPGIQNPAVLVGIDHQKTAFTENIDRFLGGRPAHDVLLWGERGTGKSSLVRTLLGRRAGPALLSVPEARIPDLPRVLDTLVEDPRKWVLFFDDLSFSGADAAYRDLKILLEGGLEARPENTLVVATSNRRHLVPEAFPGDDEIHPDETVAETVSLSDRFGLSLGFYALDETTFLRAVEAHLAHLSCGAPPLHWQEEARRWAMSRGIRSGRSAEQAAREIAGRGRAPAGRPETKMLR